MRHRFPLPMIMTGRRFLTSEANLIFVVFVAHGICFCFFVSAQSVQVWLKRSRGVSDSWRWLVSSRGILRRSVVQLDFVGRWHLNWGFRRIWKLNAAYISCDAHLRFLEGPSAGTLALPTARRLRNECKLTSKGRAQILRLHIVWFRLSWCGPLARNPPRPICFSQWLPSFHRLR